MVIFGSGTIVSELTALKLIDEYRLIVNPVILSNGNPLFKSINEKGKLKIDQYESTGFRISYHLLSAGDVSHPIL
jgi:dihydrofolate reductase